MTSTESDPLLGYRNHQANNNKLAMRCKKSLKDEFRAVNFLFRHNSIECFYEAQWKWPYIIFVIYRIFVALYTLVWVVLSAVSDSELPFEWAAWLTNWSYLLLTCHLVLACVITVFYSLKNKHFCFKKVHRITINDNNILPIKSNGATEEESGPQYITPEVSSEEDVTVVTPTDVIPWYMKISWLLYSTISSVAFIVSVVYFTALFPQISNGKPPSLIDFNFHGINSIIIIAEMILNGYPVRLLHCIYPALFGTIYTIFSIIYWLVDHTHVLYPGVLDWNHPGQTVIVLCILLLVAMPLLQLFLFGAYKLKLYIYNKIYSS